MTVVTVIVQNKHNFLLFLSITLNDANDVFFEIDATDIFLEVESDDDIL